EIAADALDGPQRRADLLELRFRRRRQQADEQVVEVAGPADHLAIGLAGRDQLHGPQKGVALPEEQLRQRRAVAPLVEHHTAAEPLLQLLAVARAPPRSAGTVWNLGAQFHLFERLPAGHEAPDVGMGVER